MEFRKILFLVFSAVILSSCSRTAPEESFSGGSTQSLDEYFLLNSFPVKQVSIPEESGNLLPWTKQVRVADYSVAGNCLFLAVNNTGIIKIPLDNPSAETFELYKDDKYISGNTMKSVFFFEDSLFCHLYHDTFFSDDYSKSSASPVIKLNSDNTITAEFKRSSIFDNKEAVDFIFAGNCWISSWKKAGSDSSSFSYYKHDIKGNNISEISEAVYRKNLVINEKKNYSDPALLKIYDFIQSLNSNVYMTDLSVKYSNCTASENHRYISSSKDSGSYVSVPVYRTEECLWFTADNKVFFLENNKITRILSETLPSGYRYTGICCEHGKIYLFWEYQSFFNTGNSGFSIIDEKRVDKIAN